MLERDLRLFLLYRHTVVKMALGVEKGVEAVGVKFYAHRQPAKNDSPRREQGADVSELFHFYTFGFAASNPEPLDVIEDALAGERYRVKTIQTWRGHSRVLAEKIKT